MSEEEHHHQKPRHKHKKEKKTKYVEIDSDSDGYSTETKQYIKKLKRKRSVSSSDDDIKSKILKKDTKRKHPSKQRDSSSEEGKEFEPECKKKTISKKSAQNQLKAERGIGMSQ